MKRGGPVLCRTLAGALALASALPALAGADTRAYPERPIRLLVGLPPGGSVDVIARTVMPKLGEALGRHIVIDNRTGAAGRLAAEIVARAPPDGLSLIHI